MTTIMKTFGVVFGIAIIVAIAVFMPLLYIWSLNTLFGLTIAYNIETWASIVLLQMFFHTTISFKGK